MQQPHHQPPYGWDPPLSATVAPARRSGAGAVVATVLVGLWAVAVAVGTSALGWLIDQVVLVSGGASPAWAWPAVSLVAGLLVAAPAVLLALVPRAAPVRAAGRAWLIAAVAMAVLGFLRAIPAVHHEAYLGAFAVLAAAGAAVLRIRRGREPVTAQARLLALAAGVAVALPWLWVGALGGVLETLLAVAAAAALGWLATNTLTGSFWAPYGPGGVRLVLLGGLVAGVALTLLAAGTGHSGTQLAELLVLPPLGFALAALYRLAPVARGHTQYTSGGGSATPAGWLIGIAAAAPLAFVDPEEISLLLSDTRDVPTWAALAAVVSLAVAAVLGLTYGLVLGRLIPHRWLAAATAAVLLVTAVGVYAGPGQPGLHGERLFVIMKQRADLSGIAATGTGFAARDARATAVYQRLVATANRSQADLRRQLDRLRLPYTPYYLVNAVEVEAGPAVRAWLSTRDDVDRVLISQQLRPLPAQAPVSRGDITERPAAVPWNLAMINADRVRQELRVAGDQIHVGTSDSGVDGAHPALRLNFRGGDDSWYDPWNHTPTPTDSGGHGTHTLGSAVGTGVGVAPGARWVGCVNLDRNLGSPARYLDCLQFMLAPFPPGGDPFTAGRPERAPHVLTNSWGCPTIEGCDVGSLRSAVAAFAAAGIYFVAAAGNTGPLCSSVDDPPAVYPDALTVGAVDRNGTVTDFSSRGPAPGGDAKPDVVAPGAAVLSAMPGGTYAELDGTSMAAPHVAGVVALMWSANPRLVGDLDRTGQILRDTAISLVDDGAADGCGGAGNVSGAGLVDAYAAVVAARALA